MAKWIETKYLGIYFGWDYEEKEHKNWLGLKKKNIEHFSMRIPFQDFRQRMQEIIHQINNEQYEIKAVMPLTEGLCASQVNSNAPSWGYGFGASTIVGYGFVLQKVVEISQEEYDIRISLAKNTIRKNELEAALPELQKAFEKAEAKPREMVEKKGLLGTRYRIVGTDYTKEEAEKIVGKNVADYEKALAELNSAKDELAQINSSLNEISARMEEVKNSAHG